MKKVSHTFLRPGAARFDMWKFVDGQKRHTQDPCELVHLMKDMGRGMRPVRAVDVGCGDGIMAFEMLMRNRASCVVAIDHLKEAIDAASFNLRDFVEKGRAIVAKKKAQSFFRDKNNWDSFDLFAINPPFFTQGSGRANKKSSDQVARHESSLKMREWVVGARKLLRTGGELYCIFPTERLAELCHCLSSNLIEPKNIWWLKKDKRKRRFFLRAVRGARSGVNVYWTP